MSMTNFEDPEKIIVESLRLVAEKFIGINVIAEKGYFLDVVCLVIWLS